MFERHQRHLRHDTLTLNLTPAIAASDSAEDRDAARRVDGIANRMFLDPILRGTYPADIMTDLAPLLSFDHVQEGDLTTISEPIEMLGVNYFFRHFVRSGPGDRFRGGNALVGAGDVEFASRGLPRTAMDWEVDADGLAATLVMVSNGYAAPPLWVTENGAAYPDVVGPDREVHDPERIAYLDAHIRAAHRALESGVDLRGYFVWSALDNFEWAYGLSRRFGLIYVDYESLRRTPKDSARWYRDVVTGNGLVRGSSAGARQRSGG